MNETPSTVPGDNSDADIDLGYEKKFHNRLNNYDNESLYIPIVRTLSEWSVIPMIADEDVVDHIPKNPQPCVRNHVCTHGAAARTQSCTESCSSYLWWRSCIVCTPLLPTPFCWGVEPPTKFSKRRRLDQISIFRGDLLRKRGDWLLSGGLQFLHEK